MTTFTAPPPGSTNIAGLTFQLTVKDTAGLTDSDSVHITVNHVTPPQPVDKRPVANAGHPGPDQNVNEGSLVTLNGSASTDPDIGDTLTYSWTQTAGPSVTLSNPTSAMTTFSSPTTRLD